jgi:hypothetical protein
VAPLHKLPGSRRLGVRQPAADSPPKFVYSSSTWRRLSRFVPNSIHGPAETVAGCSAVPTTLSRQGVLDPIRYPSERFQVSDGGSASRGIVQLVRMPACHACKNGFRSKNLAGATGLEPATSWVRGSRLEERDRDPAYSDNIQSNRNR